MPTHSGVRKANLTSCSCQSVQEVAGIKGNALETVFWVLFACLEARS